MTGFFVSLSKGTLDFLYKRSTPINATFFDFEQLLPCSASHTRMQGADGNGESRQSCLELVVF